MARKSFRKRVINRIRRTLRMNEMNNVIEKEFTDSRGNKSKLRLDFNPHLPKDPTIELQYDYGDNK